MPSPEKCVHVTFKGQSYSIPMSYVNDEHPGGPDEILAYADKDITKAFEDAGHSADAEATLCMYLDGAGPQAREAAREAQAARYKGGEEGERRIAETDRWARQQTLVAVSAAVATAGIVALFLWRNTHRH